MAPRQFTGAFTQQEPIGDAAIAAAVEVMKTGRLHRYNTVAGEQSQASLLEAEYAAYQEQSYCLACASGGYAMHIALLAAGMQRGEPVLTNAFTLSPVPGAIVNAGGRPVLVECTRDLVIDLDDLDAKAAASGARFLLLSHMRGHMADMDRIADIVAAHGMTLIEDCAHTMGATWNGTQKRQFRPCRLLQHPDLQAHEFGRGRSSDLERSGIHGARHHPVGLLHALRAAWGRSRRFLFRRHPAGDAELLGTHGQSSRGDPAAPAGRARQQYRALERAIQGAGIGAQALRAVLSARPARCRTLCRQFHPVSRRRDRRAPGERLRRSPTRRLASS